MRRILSILLVLLFGMGPVTFALGYDAEASLPACCRRHGAHSCAMSAAGLAYLAKVQSQTPAFTSPSHCPMFPRHGSASPATHFAFVESGLFAIRVMEQARAEAPAGGNFESIHLRGPALRGPPTSPAA